MIRNVVFARASAAASAVQGSALDVRIATDGAEIDRLWAVRHAASPILAGLTDGRRSLQVIEDGCVPVARLAEYLDVIDEACRAERIDVVMFGHAGDGHVHVNLLPNLQDADWNDRVRAIFSAVSAAVIRLGGTPSGEHGTGRLRAGLMRQLYGPEVMECFAAVKRAFDPAGLFNPGVILGDGSDPLSRLKVGTAAAALPPGVDEYLAAIERTPLGRQAGGKYFRACASTENRSSPSSADRNSSSRRTCRSSGASRGATASGWQSSPAGSAT